MGFIVYSASEVCDFWNLEWRNLEARIVRSLVSLMNIHHLLTKLREGFENWKLLDGHKEETFQHNLISYNA